MAFSMMLRLGYIAAPPTITVCSLLALALCMPSSISLPIVVQPLVRATIAAIGRAYREKFLGIVFSFSKQASRTCRKRYAANRLLDAD
jgi:hypothetical protein